MHVLAGPSADRVNQRGYLIVIRRGPFGAGGPRISRLQIAELQRGREDAPGVGDGPRAARVKRLVADERDHGVMLVTRVRGGASKEAQRGGVHWQFGGRTLKPRDRAPGITRQKSRAAHGGQDG